MILFVDPDQEVLGVVVPDSTGVGPVTRHTGGQEEGRDGLVEEEVVFDQFVLFRFGHAAQRIVFSCKRRLIKKVDIRSLNIKFEYEKKKKP